MKSPPKLMFSKFVEKEIRRKQNCEDKQFNQKT